MKMGFIQWATTASFRAGLALVATVFCTNSLAESNDSRTFRLRDAPDQSVTSSTTASLPIYKTYYELSQAQKDYLNRAYEHMGEGDEPPYPVEGMIQFARPLTLAQQRLEAEGAIYLVIDVSAEGDALSVTRYGSAGDEMDQFATSLAMLTKYKPALCRGVPCPQQFPFAFEFKFRISTGELRHSD